ncbi:CRP-like cAMP-binding protein [Tenacibaculum adriaticum]|uniref:CRP-like cAMP-binding protein n=1 Tax=Tenacibaculum adriaticum TaxID=413713 RepID=A0A5S5DSI0_9FLAO|nr:Crp/Fnr family transcriptional regulator [Tenacibaculum adriaticum]TYP98890.1 CRP-like cAMP-binding protein [Tenacibaculum adriaticum]
MKPLFLPIFKTINLSLEEIEILKDNFTEVHFKKGDIILHSNESVLYQYYVIKGCLRTFYIDKNGKEHTIQFAINDWWISDYIGYFSETKSVLNIECIEDAVLLKVAKTTIENTYDKIPKLERFFRKKMERSFVSFQKRILANLSQTAKERYQNFIKTYPNIEQHVKNYHIASYLGITTESLSRIRKGIAQK